MDAGVLSVDLQGASIHRVGGRLRVQGPDGVVRVEVPAFKVRSIWLFGSVEVTNPVLRLALSEGPVLHFLTRTGKYRGCVGPEPGHRGALRMCQYRRLRRPSSRLTMAREVVAAKLRTLLTRVRSWSRNRQGGMVGTIQYLVAAADQLVEQTTIDGLMGVEGAASREYFQAYGRLFTFDWGFSGRNRRPPRDPVNALLSLGYTLLYSEMVAAVQLSCLDPYLGALHQVQDGRCSLALDVMEPFRWVVDELVVSKMNLATFTAGDFRQEADGAVFLQPEVLPRVIAAFGERMVAPLFAGDPKGPTVRAAMRQVVKTLRGVFLHQDRDIADAFRLFA